MESSTTRRVRCAGFLFAALTATGCASLPPPRELDLRQLRIVGVDTPPRVDINGLPGGKAVGAAVGAGTGSGAGALLGAAACAGMGPFFPLCVLTVVPTALGIGAVTGGVVGAVRTESTEAIGLKARALHDHLAGSLYPRTLALRLEEELRQALGDDAPRPGTSQAVSGDVAPWTLDVSIAELATEGKREFALRLVARIALRRSGEVDPVWSVAKEVQSETELTTTAWAADQGHAMQVVLDRCIRSAAHELRIDLTRPFDASAASSHPRSRYSTSCNDVPADATPPTATPSLGRDEIEPTSSSSTTADPAITREAT